MVKDRIYKAKLIVIIDMYFGAKTAQLYKTYFADMSVDYVEKSAEKLFTEHLGSERAQTLLKQIKQDL